MKSKSTSKIGKTLPTLVENSKISPLVKSLSRVVKNIEKTQPYKEYIKDKYSK